MRRKIDSVDAGEQRIQNALLILQILVLIVLVALAIVIGISMTRAANKPAPPAVLAQTDTPLATAFPTGVIPPTQPINLLPSATTLAETSPPSAMATRTLIPTPTAFNNPLADYTVDALTARVYDG